jgi:hypothetical protein
MDNRISYTMDDQTFNSIKAKINELISMMPFLVDLTPEEKRALPKFGDKSFPFVMKTLEAAIKNPGALPASFSIEEMQKDVALYSQLYSLLLVLRVFMDKLEDTYLLAGSEAYASGLTVYRNLQANSDLLEGANIILDDLGSRFVRKSSGIKPEAQKVS